MAKKKEKTPSFEEAMTELEKLVESMENDSLSLEDSLTMFEKGVQLTRICQQALSKAEQEIKILTTNDDEMDFAALDD
jgi:exodeoxyribonuclease VII small subunit